MSIDELTTKEKLELFGKANEFRISNEIIISNRTGYEDTDRWAIVMDGRLCYCKKNDKWEYEPMPSSRTDNFIARTRYTLCEALKIVKSPKFVSKYLQSDSKRK